MLRKFGRKWATNWTKLNIGKNYHCLRRLELFASHLLNLANVLNIFYRYSTGVTIVSLYNNFYSDFCWYIYDWTNSEIMFNSRIHVSHWFNHCGLFGKSCRGRGCNRYSWKKWIKNDLNPFYNRFSIQIDFCISISTRVNFNKKMVQSR